ncbi:protein regulator of cytokinesis 1-like, partial [Cydia pomonella]|uniref:protein regulator of cytokinesis 1-like n=1 Tax=Cydia pomonella TaxID=82600 RepID=UPI002ADD9E2A
MFTEEVYHLFDGVTEEVSRNVRRLMVELWLNWSHVGIEYEDKVRNINQLVEIEENLHRDLLDETKRQVKTMKKKVEELKEEGKKLCKNLSIDISIIEHKEDMMLFEYKKELEKQIMRFTQQIEQRQIEMNRLLEWQHDLTEKLGVTFNELQDNRLPPQDELDKLRNHLAGLQSKRDERCKIFLRTQIEIKKIMDELQMRPQSEFEQVVFSSRSVDFKSTDLNMDRLAMLQQDLQEKYHQTNKRVLKLRQHLEGLWDCLDKDQTYRENFLKAHPGCHAATEAAIEEEIKRCETIQVLVTNVRTEIKLMWDNVMFSSAQREEFAYYHQDVFTAETLQIHKMYLDTITEYYNEHKPIFELVATRRKLWLKQAALDARVAEPGRLHNRGGNLLREEKQRKAIEVNLPKIETQIREIVTEYEAKSGKTFIVDGVPLLQLIEDEKESRIAERRNKLSARKRARAQAQAQAQAQALTGAAASRAPSPRAPAPRAPSSPRA